MPNLDDNFIEKLSNYLIIRMKDIFVTKEDLTQQINHIPTKDEFYDQTEKIITELKTIREEHTIQGHQVKRNTKRIEKLETNVRHLQSSAV